MTIIISDRMTREQWLEAAVEELRPLFAEIDVEVPAVRVSVGWPSRGGTANKGKVIGQCWKTTVATDGVAQIFISPVLGESDKASMIKLLGVLAHELIHAWDDCESGHKGDFRKAAKALGLTGKMTATVVEEGSELWDKLAKVFETLGEFPHAALVAGEMDKQRKKQTTRMLKLACPVDGYLVRTTLKWLDELGLPSCPCGHELEPAA